MYKIYVGLGSNISPVRSLNLALQALAQAVTLIQVSSWYQSAATLEEDNTQQIKVPDFINLAVSAHTTLTLTQVKTQLKNIEKRIEPQRPTLAHHHRIDIDLYAHTTKNNLQINPLKPELLTCAYALRPLLEIEPELSDNLQPLQQYLNTMQQQILTPINPSHW